MQIRKILAVLAAGMLCTALPAAGLYAAAEEEETQKTYTDGMFTFGYTDGGVELVGCDTGALSVKIPAETDGYKIVGIGDGAFYSCANLVSVEMTDNIRYIGRYAFSGCESLTSLTIPDSVQTIGANAMSGCYTLETLHLPEHLTEIPEGMCYTCVSLTDVNIPDGVTSIGDEAFYSCTMLPDVELPDSVTTLGNYAFAFCSAFEHTDIPKGVTKLGAGTFCGCDQVESFTVPAQLEDLGSLSFLGCASLTEFSVEEGNLIYTAQDGVLYSKDQTILYAYPSGNPQQSFDIPEGVTTIHDAAFFGAEHLTAVHFPATLQFVGAGGFENCTALKSVEFPEGTEILYENAFTDCTALQSVSLPSTLRGVGKYAFYNCPKLLSITVPTSCKTIGEYAFGYVESTDADGNQTPVKLEGFKQRSSGLPVSKVVGICIAVLGLGGVILLLVSIIRKNQMTPEEHEENVLANEDYTGITEEAEEADDTPET